MKKLLALLLGLVLASGALAQPTLDTHNTSSSQGGTTTTIAVTTSQTNDIVVVASNIGGTTTSLPSLSISGCGLTWASLGSNSASLGGGGGFGDTVQMWWGLATSTLSACTVTVTSTLTIDAAATVYCSFHGAQTSSPVDPNGALPVTAANNTSSITSPTGNVSTTRAHDVAIAAASTNQGPPTNTAQSPAVLCDTKANSAGVRWSTVGVIYSSFTSPQTSTAVAFSNSFQYWLYVASALTADAAAASGALSFGHSFP